MTIFVQKLRIPVSSASNWRSGDFVTLGNKTYRVVDCRPERMEITLRTLFWWERAFLWVRRRLTFR